VTSVGVLYELHSQEIFRWDLFLTFEVLLEMYYLPMNFDFGTGEITAGTYRVIYSLYGRRVLSFIYGRCVYKMNVILHESTHTAVVYTLTLFDTVTTTQNTLLGRQAATEER
jgi:hypothetical protein